MSTRTCGDNGAGENPKQRPHTDHRTCPERDLPVREFLAEGAKRGDTIAQMFPG